MDPRFYWHFFSLSFFVSLSLSRSGWCNVKLGTEPSSAAAMRPVLTHGYSSSFSASNPHFSIISSPACVCERLTVDGDYRFLPMNQHKHNWSLSFTFYSPVLSVCHRASPTLWAVTPEQDAHLVWTQLYTYVCVWVAHACHKTSSRDLGQSEMWSAPLAAPSRSRSARLGEGNSGNSVWLWAAEASSQQLPSIRGAQWHAGRERDPIRGQAGRLEPGQPYCPPLLSYTAPGLGLHHTHPCLSTPTCLSHFFCLPRYPHRPLFLLRLFLSLLTEIIF